MNNFKEALAKISMISLPAVLILALFIMFFKVKIQKPEVGVSTPSPAVTPTAKTLSPTRWATDSAILTIEENILNIEKELEEVDLKHASLQLPVLDMNVGF